MSLDRDERDASGKPRHTFHPVLRRVYLTLPAKAAMPHPEIAAISNEISAL
jgi:hypothetical protein